MSNRCIEIPRTRRLEPIVKPKFAGLTGYFLVALMAVGATTPVQTYAQSATTLPKGAAPTARCVASTDGRIDFQGRLGNSGHSSIVQIFPLSDGAQAYADNIERQLGVKHGTVAIGSHQTTMAELEAMSTTAMRVPAAMASASIAPIVNGQFRCDGFTPGRYLMLAQVKGASADAGQVKVLIAYYRADVDVSSIRGHVTIIVPAFRRIGSFPPAI